MSSQTEPRLLKWPFLFGDLCLLTVAAVFVFRSVGQLSAWQMLICSAAVGLGAWFCVIPFLQEYRASVRLGEAEALHEALAQFKALESVAGQITQATSRWQSAQDYAQKTVVAAEEMTQRIGLEAKAFTEFLTKANDQERAHLRLEVEKLRRAEAEWLQVLIRMLDHVFALHQAAVRSGQRTLIEQLGQFQQACRDAGRRVGLVPYSANPEEPFDPKLHQLANPEETPAAGSRVVHTIATGYTFQGQFVRRALVAVQPPDGGLAERPSKA